MATTVVHVNDEGGYDIYIGRAVPRKGLKRSIWHNPFTIGKDGTRDEVIALYEEYVRARPVLMSQLWQLRGKRLGCWCYPDACHGDVLRRLVEELGQKPRTDAESSTIEVQE